MRGCEEASAAWPSLICGLERLDCEFERLRGGGGGLCVAETVFCIESGKLGIRVELELRAGRAVNFDNGCSFLGSFLAFGTW